MRVFTGISTQTTHSPHFLLKPSHLTARSQKKVWWLCKNKHTGKVHSESEESATSEEKVANKRKSYTDDFKKEVAEAASKPGATLKSVGDQFDVNPTLVRNWKIQFASSSGSMQS